MEKLPVEVLQEILLNLTYKDVQFMRLVNTSFYDASLIPSITKREILTWSDPIELLSEIERKFYHFHFTRIAITRDFEEFVDKRGPFVHSLKFELCSILDSASFFQSLEKCVNLKSLTFKIFDIVALTDILLSGSRVFSLPSLEYLYIKTAVLNEEITSAFYSLAPNIKNLYARSPKFDFDRFFYRMSERAMVNLRRIEIIDNKKFSDAQLIRLANVNFVDLQIIRLKGCLITDRGVLHLVRMQTNLQVIKLSSCCLTDNSLLGLAGYSNNLRIFSIERCPSVTFTGLYMLMVRSSMFSVTARHLSELPSDIIPFFYREQQLMYKPILKDLTIESVGLRRIDVQFLATNFSTLTNLNLSGGLAKVTDVELRLICCYLPNLVVLDLSECCELTDKGFQNDDDNSGRSFCESLSNLEYLKLSHCKLITDVTVEKYLKLPSLMSLCLICCPKLTVRSFIAMADNCPYLEVLDMSKSLKVNRKNLLGTVPLLKRLTLLSVEWNVRDKATIMETLYDSSECLKWLEIGKQLFVRSLEHKKFIVYIG